MKINIIIAVLSILAGVLLAPVSVYADETTDFNSGSSDTPSTNAPAPETDNGKVATSIIECKSNDSGKVEDSCVWSLLLTAINIMTAGIGLLAVGGVIYGSILYTTAGGSMDQTKQAIKIIQNVIIGLVAYAFMYSFLNYVIPGGLF